LEKAVCGGSEAENVDVEMEEVGEEGRAEAPPPPPTPPPASPLVPLLEPVLLPLCDPCWTTVAGVVVNVVPVAAPAADATVAFVVVAALPIVALFFTTLRDVNASLAALAMALSPTMTLQYAPKGQTTQASTVGAAKNRCVLLLFKLFARVGQGIQ
jgi:hypothetical protein